MHTESHSQSSSGAADVPRHLSQSALHLKKGEYEVAYEHATTAMSLIEKTGDERHLDLVIEMLCLSCQHSGRLKEATAWAERGLALHRQSGRQELVASHLGLVGSTLVTREMYEEAIVPLQKAVRLARTLKLDKIVGGCLFTLSQAYTALDRTEESMRCLEEAIPAFERVGHAQARAGAQVHMAILRAGQGEHRQALALLEGAVPVLRRASDHRNLSVALRELAAIQEHLGELRAAIHSLGEHREVQLQLRDRPGACFSQHRQGELWQRLGDNARAAECFLSCVQLAREISHGSLEGLALYGLAVTCEDIDIAQVSYLKALPLLEADEALRGHLGSVLLNLGALLLKEGEAQAAMAYLPRAVLINREHGEPRSLALSLLDLGGACCQLGRHGEAIAPLSEAQAIFQAGGEADMVAIAAERLTAARLGAEAAEAATTSGRLN